MSGTNNDLPKVCKPSYVVAEPRLVLACFRIHSALRHDSYEHFPTLLVAIQSDPKSRCYEDV